MKCLYVNTHFAPDFQYGGVVESSSKIFKYVKRVIPFFVVATSQHPNFVNNYLEDCGICFKSIFFHRFGFSIALIFPLWRLIKIHQLIVINGIFTFPVTVAAFFSIIQKKPFVVSIRGGLEPWRLNHKKIRKLIYNYLITYPLLRRASCIHVTSEDEYRNLYNLGFKNLKLVTNGIDVELINSFIPTGNKFFSDKKFVFLFMSRTDKEKGVNILLDAYSKFRKINPYANVNLAIVGPDHQGYLEKMGINYGESDILRINGVYGLDKFQIIYESGCIILPSYSENFGNIVAEGMAMARPVITTTGTPWSALKDNNMGFYAKPTSDHIYMCMQACYELSNYERAEMGAKARKYILENMSWSIKAEELIKMFRMAYENKK